MININNTTIITIPHNKYEYNDSIVFLTIGSIILSHISSIFSFFFYFIYKFFKNLINNRCFHLKFNILLIFYLNL